jgi:hypothetical protein
MERRSVSSPIAAAVELTGGTVVSQDPPDNPVDVDNPVQVTLTFDRDLPALSNGDRVFYDFANLW